MFWDNLPRETYPWHVHACQLLNDVQTISQLQHFVFFLYYTIPFHISSPFTMVHTEHFQGSFRVQMLILFQKFPNILCVKVFSHGRADPVKQRATYLSVLASHLSGFVSLAVGLIRTFYHTNKIQLSLIYIKYDFSGWKQYQSHLFLSLSSWAPSLLNWGHTSSEVSCQITPLCSCSSVLAKFKV